MKRSNPMMLAIRLLCVCLFTMMCASLYPQSALASPAAFDPAKNRVEVSADKYEDAKGSFPLGGTWEWNSATNTLTLENAVVKDTTGEFWGFYLRSDDNAGPLTIKFKGTNTIFANRGGYPATPINYSGIQDLIFEGDGTDAILNLEATSWKDGTQFGAPIGLSITHAQGTPLPGLVFKSGKINILAEHRVADMDLDQLSDEDWRGAYSPMGIFGSFNKLEVQDQAQLTVRATTDDPQLFTSYSVNTGAIEKIVFDSSYPTVFEATTGTKQGQKFGFIPGTNVKYTFSGKAPVHFNTSGLGSPVYVKGFDQGFVSADPDAYEIGIINPATGFLNNTFVAASTSMTQLVPVFATNDEHDVAVGRVYRIEQSFANEDGKEIVVENNGKRVEPTVSTNDKIVIQRAVRAGAPRAYVLVDKVPVKLAAPAKLGELVFKEWKGLDDLGIAPADLEKPVVNFVMPAHHIKPVAVYEPVRTGQIEVKIADDANTAAALKVELVNGENTAITLDHAEGSATWATKKDLPAGTYTLRVSSVPEGFELVRDEELADNVSFTLVPKADENGATPGEQPATVSEYSATITITKDDLRTKEIFVMGLKLNDVREPEPGPEPEPEPAPMPDPEPDPNPAPTPDPEPEPQPAPDPEWSDDPQPAEPVNPVPPVVDEKPAASTSKKLPQTSDVITGALLFAGLGVAAIVGGILVMKRRSDKRS